MKCFVPHNVCFVKITKCLFILGYSLLIKTDKKSAVHTRIIWTCSWTHDGKYFGTGSRDGKVVIWETDTQKPYSPLELPEFSVTSLAFAPTFATKKDEYLTSIGVETGEIFLYGFTPFIENSWRLCFKIDGKYPFCGKHVMILNFILSNFLFLFFKSSLIIIVIISITYFINLL